MMLVPPTVQSVNEAWNIYISKEENYLAEEALVSLFASVPDNNKLEQVWSKVTLLDKWYGTNLRFSGGPLPIAKHIVSLGIRNEIIDGELNIVNEIAKTPTRHQLSFAAKYCSFHNQESYPIYDSYVAEVLWEYKSQFGFSIFSRKDLRDYAKFKSVIDDFIGAFGLTGTSYKELDKFLWQAYPKNVEKKVPT
jgi:hypothetical protein